MIRKATNKDVKKMARIFREGYSEEPYNERWSEEITEKRLKQDIKTEEVFVLEEDNKIKGLLILKSYLWWTGLRGFIHEIVVDKESRGKGYGKQLLEFAEQHFKKIGAKEVQLMTLPTSNAYKIYKKLNYKDEGLVSLYKKI
jgi:ribosomal protein S18 acetylase RimI-like enzyme